MADRPTAGAPGSRRCRRRSARAGFDHRAEGGSGERSAHRDARHRLAHLRHGRRAGAGEHADGAVDRRHHPTHVVEETSPREQHVGPRLLVGLQPGDGVVEVVDAVDQVSARAERTRWTGPACAISPRPPRARRRGRSRRSCRRPDRRSPRSSSRPARPRAHPPPCRPRLRDRARYCSRGRPTPGRRSRRPARRRSRGPRRG